jgi:hypothetical protein
MATAELAPTGRPARAPAAHRVSLLALWFRVYCFIWMATLVPAGIVALAGAPLVDPIRGFLDLALDPARNPPPHFGSVLLLAAYNLRLSAWPLLLGPWGAHRSHIQSRAADALLLVLLIANASQVGAAVGAYGTRALLPYLPGLPLEWAAIALGATAWLRQRQREMTPRSALATLTLIAILLLGAAVLETVAVPHRA